MKNLAVSLLLLFACSAAFAQQEFGARNANVASEFDKLAQTPPMGWNSWNKFGTRVSEELLMGIADAMVSSGMKDAGYEYVVIDDGWQIDRDAEGNIVVDPELFPHGMKYLADYIHGLGLKFGIYSCAGSKTCQGRPGSRGYQFQDARQYARWGVDYLKYDWCSNEGQNAQAAYKTMSDALKISGRPIVFSICEWGRNDPWLWAPNGIGHLWRITADIRDCYDCSFNWGGVGVLQILDKALTVAQYAGPGRWNDLEMLEIGNGKMTQDEYRSHMAIWCMMSAPLMSGNDLREMDTFTRDLLCNKDAIAIDQDALGKSASRFLTYNGVDILVKPLTGGDIAFLFVNRNNTEYQFDYSWMTDTIYDRNLPGGRFYARGNPHNVKNVWTGKVIGTTDKPLSVKMKPHESLFFRLSKI